jgi:hypothetical protein
MYFSSPFSDLFFSFAFFFLRSVAYLFSFFYRPKKKRFSFFFNLCTHCYLFFDPFFLLKKKGKEKKRMSCKPCLPCPPPPCPPPCPPFNPCFDPCVDRQAVEDLYNIQGFVYNTNAELSCEQSHLAAEFCDLSKRVHCLEEQAENFITRCDRFGLQPGYCGSGGGFPW